MDLLNKDKTELKKENLFKWLQLIEEADEDFKNQDLQAMIFLIPYLYKHISIKNWNRYDDIRIDKGSELFESNYYEVFHQLEFENLYQDKLFWNTIMVNHYLELDILASDIINQT